MRENLLYTAGHSSRSVTELCDLLRSVQTSLVADVRSFPRSARFPCYERGAFGDLLRAQGFDYRWFGHGLGGRRKSVAGSPQTALDPERQGYADHMGTGHFRRSVEDLLDRARDQVTVILCAERHPGHCHRSLLCDYIVTLSDFRVIHLLETGLAEEHEPSPLLRWIGQKPVYDRFVTGALFPKA